MKRVLIIEDDPDQREALTRALSLSTPDIEFLAVASGQEGLLEMRRQPFDIVVTDIIMPGKDGLSTIAELHSEFPDVGIVAVSGGRNPGYSGLSSLAIASIGRGNAFEELRIAESMGATKTLSKPFSAERLLGIVESMFHDRTVAQARR